MGGSAGRPTTDAPSLVLASSLPTSNTTTIKCLHMLAPKGIEILRECSMGQPIGTFLKGLETLTTSSFAVQATGFVGNATSLDRDSFLNCGHIWSTQVGGVCQNSRLVWHSLRICDPAADQKLRGSSLRLVNNIQGGIGTGQYRCCPVGYYDTRIDKTAVHMLQSAGDTPAPRRGSVLHYAVPCFLVPSVETFCPLHQYHIGPVLRGKTFRKYSAKNEDLTFIS